MHGARVAVGGASYLALRPGFCARPCVCVMVSEVLEGGFKALANCLFQSTDIPIYYYYKKSRLWVYALYDLDHTAHLSSFNYLFQSTGIANYCKKSRLCVHIVS
jgi:hypothetical protein